MNILFCKYSKRHYNFYSGDKLFIKYYDRFRFLHSFRGVCLKKRKVFNTFYVVIYDKSKGFYFSFFLNSPFIVSVFKK